MNHIKSFLIAAILTPLIPAIPLSLATSIFEDFTSKIGGIILFYFFTIMAEIFFGIPLFFLLKIFKAVNLGSSLLGGAIVGGLVALVVSLPSQAQLNAFLVFIPAGAISSLCFYSIYQYMLSRP